MKRIHPNPFQTMSDQANYSDAPNSPVHPDPDQEASNLPERSLPGSVLDLLDLNPDLEAKTATESTTRNTNGLEHTIDDHLYDRLEDFQPTLVPSPLNPVQPHLGRRLSSSQQSKFINYADERLLHIQRRFVQSFGLSELGYSSIDELLNDVKQLLNFVWLSIDSNPTIHDKEYYSTLPDTNFGQTHFLIRIAGDLVEYVGKMEITQASGVEILKLLKSLDDKFARLIDGTIPGGKSINRTESVRLYGIAERTRVLVSDLFEKKQIEGFHYELSKVYEQVLDRTA